MLQRIKQGIVIAAALSMSWAFAHQQDQSAVYLMRIKASDKFERTDIVNQGMSIERIEKNSVQVIGTKEQMDLMKQKGLLLDAAVYNTDGSLSVLSGHMSPLDFPANDSQFHNYREMQQMMESLAASHSNIMKVTSIGKSLEGRELWMATISGDLATEDQKAGVAFVGGHHAREHISVETPLNLMKYLVEEYAKGNADVKRLVDSRAIYILPSLNPDGSEYDIATGRYQMWRKNRRAENGRAYGVDLNRNYGFGWGGGGASTNKNDETYRGPNAFSEPETQAYKAFVESHDNITTLLSMHTFSELVLYPWGHQYDSISDARDFEVHKVMAETMAQWNGYTPQQSSDLYIASGDTTDWTYGVHKIISFTFELDPSSMWEGGFYPGQAAIQRVFQKNIRPFMYLIENANNPYQVLDPRARFGINETLLSGAKTPKRGL